MSLLSSQIKGYGLLTGINGQEVGVHPLLPQYVIPYVSVGISVNGMFHSNNPGPILSQSPGQIGQRSGLLQTQYGDIREDSGSHLASERVYGHLGIWIQYPRKDKSKIQSPIEGVKEFFPIP